MSAWRAVIITVLVYSLAVGVAAIASAAQDDVAGNRVEGAAVGAFVLVVMAAAGALAAAMLILAGVWGA